MKYARWRYRTLGGIPVKKGNFQPRPPFTPTEKRCMNDIIKILVKTWQN